MRFLKFVTCVTCILFCFVNLSRLVYFKGRAVNVKSIILYMYYGMLHCIVWLVSHIILRMHAVLCYTLYEYGSFVPIMMFAQFRQVHILDRWTCNLHNNPFFGNVIIPGIIILLYYYGYEIHRIGQNFIHVSFIYIKFCSVASF